MTGVITWVVDCGDGVCIEREQPSTAYRSMPHFVSFVKPQSVDAQMGELRSDHIGAFKTLNETTNFRPQQGANTSIVHLEHDAADTAQIGALKPSHVRYVAASADNDSIVHLEGDAIVGTTAMDKQFTTGGGGDSLTGEDRPMNVWTNGSATSFEDRLTEDFDSNDVVIGVKENIDWTAANGGPGSSYLTSKAASKTNAYVDEDVDGFMKLDDIRGEFSPSRQVDRDPSENVDRDPGDNIVGTAIARDHNHGNRSNWDVICDIGTSIKQTSVADALTNGGTEGYTEVEWTYLKGDVWTNGSATSIRDGVTGSGFHDGLANGVVHPDMPMDTHPNDILLGFPGSGSDDLTNYRPFSEMNQGDPFSELDQGVFAPVNVLRSDNRF